MSRFTWTALGLAAVQAVVASPAAEAPPVAEPHAALITPSPALHRRDYAANFFGYALGNDGLASSFTCNSPYTYSTSGRYAGCAGRGLYLGVNCGFGYITYQDSSSASCRNYCATNLVYFSTDDLSPSSYVDCWTDSVGIEILRTSIQDTATVGRVTITVTPSTTPGLTPTSTSAPTSTSTSTSTTTTSPVSPPTTTPTPKPKNMAPIIGGAVGGALILLGLIGLGLFFFFRKRSQKNHSANPGGFGNQHNQPALVSSSPYAPQSHKAAMTYASPVGPPPMSPYQPAPYAAPPMYGQEKSAPYGVTSPVQQAEYRLPDGTAEVHGISSPAQPNQAPRAGANELA